MINDREYVLGNGIEYIPFRNVENAESPAMSLAYTGDTEHFFRLVNDGDGRFHYELECRGPLRTRMRHGQIWPNMNRGNCVGVILTDVSEQSLKRWKDILRLYFEEHSNEIQTEYDRMKEEDNLELSRVWDFDDRKNS